MTQEPDRAEVAEHRAQLVAERFLSEAYELVLAGWCQGAPARDERGQAVEPASAAARKWSAPGALERVWRRSDLDPDLALEAFQRANLALASVVHGPPGEWNDADDRGLTQVLDALAEAALSVVDERPEPPSRHGA